MAADRVVGRSPAGRREEELLMGAAADEPGSLHALVLQSLDDDQAQEIVSIPLEGKSSIADHMVIASGRSNRQVAAMAEKLAERIKHDFGLSTRYGHMSKVRAEVGQRVSRGDRIGDMGNSGRSTGTHLHYEVRLSGSAVNPMTFIRAANNVF